MRPHRAFGVLLMFVALESGWVPALGGDSAAEAALKAKGLAKAGRVFVIEAERPVLAKLKEVKASFAGYASLAEKQAAFERYEAQAARLEEHRAELKSNLDDLNERIIEQGASQAANGPARQGPGGGPSGGGNSSSPLIMQRDQMKIALAEVALGQKGLKADAPVVKDKTALEEEVQKKGESFKKALAALRAMVDRVTGEYAELGADDSVRKALGDLEKAAKVKVKLGPSDPFLAAVKELDQAERRFLGKKPAVPAKKKAKPMK